MRRILSVLLLLGMIGLGGAWAVTRPTPLPADSLAGLTGDPARGEQVFWAGGCASCHAAPEAEGEDRLKLGGGLRLPSPFGTFVAPNISSDPEHGIGTWSALDLANAMQRGLSPQGRHYYPAFPYVAYANTTLQDIVDLKAFLDTLPAETTPDQPHDLRFPFSIRPLLGGWKLLYAGKGFVLPEPSDAQIARGRYLAEALGHCGECHTPRGPLGGLNRDQWLGGAAIPAGEGETPNITPGGLDWSATDIAFYLETGFTPQFDSAGGEMASVVKNMAHLPAADREAIAAYLKAVPAVE